MRMIYKFTWKDGNPVYVRGLGLHIPEYEMTPSEKQNESRTQDQGRSEVKWMWSGPELLRSAAQHILRAVRLRVRGGHPASVYPESPAGVKAMDVIFS